MTKKIAAPAKKAVTKAAPAAAKPTAVKAPVPVPATTPATPAKPVPTAVEPKKIDLNRALVKDAIAKGQALIKEGKSKADAAMVIYEALKAEDKEVIAAAFVLGATLTEKGSVTYFYNCRRKAKKAAPKPA